jgi:uncharacterized protein YidB (DUF937 family)
MSDPTRMMETELNGLLGRSGDQQLPEWVTPAVATVVGAVTGRAIGEAPGGSAGGALGTAMGGLLGGAVGGGAFNQLVDRLDAAGLGSEAQSWIGTGENEPLDAEELDRLLGTDTVQAVAHDIGRSPDEVKSGLAHAVPLLVNALTPEGKLPEDADLTELGSRLARPGEQTSTEPGRHNVE